MKEDNDLDFTGVFRDMSELTAMEMQKAKEQEEHEKLMAKVKKEQDRANKLGIKFDKSRILTSKSVDQKQQLADKANPNAAKKPPIQPYRKDFRINVKWGEPSP